MKRKELEQLIETVISRVLSEVNVSDKDWTRMLNLIVTGDNGQSVAKSITDKDKAINRFVAGLKLTKSDDNYFSNPEQYRGEFSEFGNRAIQLGATHKEIQDILNKTKTPDKYFDEISKLKSKKMGNRFVSDITKTVLKNGFDIEYLPHNGYALTNAGKEAMARNGRKWTIGYKTEINLGDKKVPFWFDAITDEGDGPTYYVLNKHYSSDIFNKVQDGGLRKFIDSLNNILTQIKNNRRQ